jgi:hypothetical protein
LIEEPTIPGMSIFICYLNQDKILWIEFLFKRSLAVMSMVGYILGLGDRHPSNLMLDRLSGKILHIDFGDCFEVAMTREKFPEKIPFRLTRMLVNAMEVRKMSKRIRRVSYLFNCISGDRNWRNISQVWITHLILSFQFSHIDLYIAAHVNPLCLFFAEIRTV